MTTDEVLDKNKDELKEFFEDKEIQILLTSNNFEELYTEWDYISSILTALFLKSNIPFLNYMKQIPPYCFNKLDISSINIPNNITSIGYGTFHSCSGLTSITIPDSVTNIGYNAFDDCSSLTKINYLGIKEQWKKINKLWRWRTHSSIKTIHCIDGDIKL